MRLRKLLALTSTAALALLGATEGQPSPGSGGVRMLRTATQVTGVRFIPFGEIGLGG